MVPCSCGGQSWVEVAPGYFRCTSQRVVSLLGDDGPVLGLCGRTWHEGGGGAGSRDLCRCGTIAGRYCTRCQLPLCGDHGVYFELPYWSENAYTKSWHCTGCCQRYEQERADRDAELAAHAAEQEAERWRHYLTLPYLERDGRP